MNEIENELKIERKKKKNLCIFQRLITGYNLEPPVTGNFLPYFVPFQLRTVVQLHIQCPLSVEQPTQESSIINQHLATDQKSQQKSVKTVTSCPVLRQITHPTLCPQRTAVQGCPVLATAL